MPVDDARTRRRRAPTTPATPPPTNATTTTTPLSNLPSCPVDALADADEPVEITFWHGLNVDNEDAINALVDSYNASQDEVVVKAENQGGYLETIDKYFQSTVADRPAVVMFPDYSVQKAIDSQALIPIEACTSAAEYDLSTFQPSALAAYGAAGVEWGMPFNISNPVLFYNRNMFVEAGLDPDQPPQTLEELRAVLAAARRLRRRLLRDRPRLGQRLGWRLVPRAMVRQHGRAVRRQRQRPARSGDERAVRRCGRCRAVDVRAAADQRRVGVLRRRQRRRRRPAVQVGRHQRAGGDGDRHVGRTRHRAQRARRRARSGTQRRRPRGRAAARARATRRRRWWVGRRSMSPTASPTSKPPRRGTSCSTW